MAAGRASLTFVSETREIDGFTGGIATAGGQA